MTIKIKDLAHSSKFYLFSGIMTLLVLGLTLFDIIFGSVSSGGAAEYPQTAIERFEQFGTSIFLGLYHLDMLNLIITVFTLPFFFALAAIHHKKQPLSTAFALCVFLLGAAVFISANTALPMLNLSGKYLSAHNEMERTAYAAAGEALLSRGTHGTPGVFMGFFLLTMANILISFIMFSGDVFKKITGLLGLFGSFVLLLYIVLKTFFPGSGNLALYIAAPGGLTILAWYLLIALKFLRKGRREV